MITQIGNLQIQDDVQVSIAGTVVRIRENEFLLLDDTGQVWVDGISDRLGTVNLTVGEQVTVIGDLDDREDFDAVQVLRSSITPTPPATPVPPVVSSGSGTISHTQASHGAAPSFNIADLQIRDDFRVTISGTVVGFRDADEFLLEDGTGSVWVDSPGSVLTPANLALGDQVIAIGDLDDAEDFDAFQVFRFQADKYIASHPDLIEALGYDLNAAVAHFVNLGITEGRAQDTFDAQAYLNHYADLQAAFGNDLAAATKHYIEHGYEELRDPLNGGFFNAGAYVASYDDLIAAFGPNTAAGKNHYRQYGRQEGRTATFQADEYLASYGDLIAAFGYNLDAAIDHFISFGSREGRARDRFDAEKYLSAFQDLQSAFGDDLDAAAQHYINYGYVEGRVW
jgi:uncharacterized protein YdeI (BOF family)